MRRSRAKTGWGRNASWVLVAATLGLSLAPPAHAQAPDEPSLADKETARELFREGDEKFREGDYDAALKAFAAADDIMGVPTTGVERARTLMNLGRLLEATEHLQRIMRIPSEPGENEIQKTARHEAATMLEEVRSRIPSLRVVVEGDGGEVAMFVDGVEVPPSAHDFPRKVDPGEHEVRIAAPGFRPEERTVQIDERQEEVVTITLTAVDGGAAVVDPWTDGADVDDGDGEGVNGYAVMMWTGFAFSAAGAIAGTVTGVMSIAKAKDLESDEKCGGPQCSQTFIDERDSALPIAHVSTASFAVAGLGATIGTIGLLLYVSDDDESAGDAATVTPVIGPTTIGISGTF